MAEGEKSGWETASTLPSPTVHDVQRMMSPWLQGRRVLDVQLMSGGLMNRNCRVTLDRAPATVVLRMYDRDAAMGAKEIAILERVRGTIPVPEVFYFDETAQDERPPFAVIQFVDGISLRDLKLAGDQKAIGEAAFDAGRLLASLQAYRFPRVGLLSRSLSVDSTFVDGPITTVSLIELMAKSPAFQRRVDDTLHERIIRCARHWDEHPEAPEFPSTLVHGDFNSRNLLVTRREGRWRIAAILDWEFAFAGSVYCDIGNFLRYEHRERPRFEPSFSRGCRDGGLDLRGDWLTAARMADLPALCEFLARESMPDHVVAEVLGLITTTVDILD